MVERKVRDFSKRGDAIPVPDLTIVQSQAYDRYLQLDKGPHERNTRFGLGGTTGHALRRMVHAMLYEGASIGEAFRQGKNRLTLGPG